jgi:undecaprenyl-diphosphatase
MDFLLSLDRALLHLINGTLTHPFFDVFFPSITDLHKTNVFRLVFVPFLFLLWVSLYRVRGFVIFFFLIVSLGIADLAGKFAKHFWERARPFTDIPDIIQRSDAGGFSFPSNHSVNMFCAAVFLSSFFPRFRIPLFTMAGLVAYSRIYNGVHYPSDVVAGMILGSIVGLLAANLAFPFIDVVKPIFRKRKRKNV